MMKRSLRIALVLITIFTGFSCAKEEVQQESFLAVTPNNISGTWELTQWRGESLPEGVFLYLELTRRDKEFTMYENLSGTSTVTIKKTGRYDLYEDDVINGIYDNSIDEYWSHSYKITELTADQMVWTATDDASDISVYTRIESVPEALLQ